jgi:hypothetical protein
VIKFDVVRTIGWDEMLIHDVDTALGQAVRDATLQMAKAATDLARRRQRAGSHRKMMEITEINTFPYSEGWTSGWEGGIKSPAWYAWFQSDGTLAARKKPLKKATVDRRTSPSGLARYAKVHGRKGITPLGFFDAATKVGRLELKKRVEALTR